MIFLSLRVTADAEGGLKNRARQRPVLQGIEGGSHQQARAGIYPRIACPVSPNPCPPAGERFRPNGQSTLVPQEICDIIDEENDPGGPRYASSTQSTITYRHL